MKFPKKLWSFFYNNSKSEMVEICKEDYDKLFINDRKPEDIEKTYQKAWESKNFEITNYWKRANYFWAFQIASFAGYFSVLSSDFYSDNPQVLYCVITIGIITSFAWALTNNGSKTWQRHWENQVDMLEDAVVGPLYKVATTDTTYSVSKINEIVSRFIVVIWCILAIKYFIDNITFSYSNNNGFDYVVFIATVALIYFVGAMFLGHGRGRFSRRKIKLYKRIIQFEEGSNEK